MKFAAFTDVDGNSLYINPDHVIAVFESRLTGRTTLELSTSFGDDASIVEVDCSMRDAVAALENP